MKFIYLKNFVLTFLILFFAGNIIFSQDNIYRIKLVVSDLSENESFTLISIYGNNIEPIDSATSQNGVVNFIYSKPLANGQYSISWENDKKYVDFLFNNEKYIELHTSNNDPIANLEVIASQENKYFVDFLKMKNELNYFVNVGDQIYSKNPKDPRLQNIINKVDSLNNEINNFSKKIPQDLLAYKVVKASVPPSIDEYNSTHPQSPYGDIKSFYKKHWFDNIDKQDSTLVNTSVIYDAVKFYLQNLVEPQDTNQYKKAVDFILSQFSWNDKQYKYVLNLLLNTFYIPELEPVFLYIYFNYMHDTQCNGSVADENYRKAMMITKLRKGVDAPELSGITTDNQTFKLSSFLGNPIFIIFWAPDCYHCKTVMPFINNLYDKYNDSIEFVGFAIDKDLQAIKVAAKEEKIKFKVITDLQGYDGENCLRWFVWGTPTFFIIDKYGKIFSSPYSYEGIEQDLENVLKL